MLLNYFVWLWIGKASLHSFQLEFDPLLKPYFSYLLAVKSQVSLSQPNKINVIMYFFSLCCPNFELGRCKPQARQIVIEHIDFRFSLSLNNWTVESHHLNISSLNLNWAQLVVGLTNLLESDSSANISWCPKVRSSSCILKENKIIKYWNGFLYMLSLSYLLGLFFLWLTYQWTHISRMVCPF